MNLILIGILFIVAFIIQYFLTFIQMNNFKKSYIDLRRKGRVIIGKKKGVFRAGCIVIFALDDKDKIIDFEYMLGTSVFSRFKKNNTFNDTRIHNINKFLCDQKRLSYSLKSAVLDAVQNYLKLSNGENIEMPKSLFENILSKFRRK